MSEVRFYYDETTYLSFEKNGSGSRILILFHGFGLTKAIFRPWLSHLGNQFTVYSIDLFYHGDSMRPHGRLRKKAWKEMFIQFLDEQNIDRFSVLGFSLGGRFAICSAIELSQRCDHLILVAPDAIYKTPWFKAATSFGLRWIFKYFMFHPKQMDWFIRNSVKTRIVSKYMADFVEKELGKAENRKRVYISWNHFKPLGYTRQKLRKAFSDASYKRTIILGSKDIVIPPKKVLPILSNCGFNEIIIDKKHHQMIQEDIGRLISELS